MLTNSKQTINKLICINYETVTKTSPTNENYTYKNPRSTKTKY